MKIEAATDYCDYITKLFQAHSRKTLIPNLMPALTKYLSLSYPGVSTYLLRSIKKYSKEVPKEQQHVAE